MKRIIVVVVVTAWLHGCGLDTASLQRGAARTASPDATTTIEEGVTDAPDGGASIAPVDARAPVVEPSDAGSAAAATCGEVGLPCCLPGSTCASGACLRGMCAVYGGAFASSDACAPRCTSPNPYTAGCSCPVGFVASRVVTALAQCGSAAVPQPTAFSFCAAPTRTIGSDFGGGFGLDAEGAACASGCRAPNPYTGSCTCPSDTTPLEARVAALDACGAISPARVVLCAGGTATSATTTFAGAYQTDTAASCMLANPLTAACSCPARSTAQTIGVALVADGATAATAANVHLCAR